MNALVPVLPGAPDRWSSLMLIARIEIDKEAILFILGEHDVPNGYGPIENPGVQQLKTADEDATVLTNDGSQEAIDDRQRGRRFGDGPARLTGDDTSTDPVMGRRLRVLLIQGFGGVFSLMEATLGSWSLVV